MRKHPKRRRTPFTAPAVALLSLSWLALSSSSALAAGNGYSPGSSAPPSAAAGGFTRIVTTRTLSSSGGIVGGKANGATGTVLVPNGALPKGGQIVLTTGTSKSIDVGGGLSLVADFSVVILNPKTGAKLAGPFDPAITITVTDPAIRRGDIVVDVTGPGKVATIAEAHVANGQAKVSFTKDPNLAIVHHR
jgi:hypothetical protein